MTNQKTRDLDDFFFTAVQFMRLEAADAELALSAQTEVVLPPQPIAKVQSNNGRKRKANTGGNGNGKNAKPKCLKGAGRYDTYTDLTDAIDKIYL